MDWRVIIPGVSLVKKRLLKGNWRSNTIINNKLYYHYNNTFSDENFLTVLQPIWLPESCTKCQRGKSRYATVWLFSSRILLWLAFSCFFSSKSIQIMNYRNNFGIVLNPCTSMSVKMHMWVWKKLFIVRGVSKSYQTCCLNKRYFAFKKKEVQ